MKIRKGLLAAATAAAVSFSGAVAAPAFAETTNTGTGTTNTNTTDTTDNGGKEKPKKSFGETMKENSSDKDGNWDPKAITAWISVFTAILGLIGTVITFSQKHINLPKF